MINKTIANFTFKHLIGSGGMSDVYYAENRLGKKAAIKVLKAELCSIGTIKQRFEQEARIMVDIEHKNIRQAYDLDEVNGQPAIIMEYLEGDTLKQLIDKGKISDEKAQKYFDQCVAALRVTHAKEIVHRDIKPSNIFITRDDEVKVLDFGIAKVKESGLGTRTNQMLGTPVYMSPEQIKSPKNVDTKSDVYSLAVTFYHALTGKVPYDSTTDSDYEIHTKIVNDDLDLSKVPSKWATLLRAMLIKAPAGRMTIKEVGGKARNQKSDDGTQIDYPEPPKPKPDPKPTPAAVPNNYLIGNIVLFLIIIFLFYRFASTILSAMTTMLGLFSLILISILCIYFGLKNSKFLNWKKLFIINSLVVALIILFDITTLIVADQEDDLIPYVLIVGILLTISKFILNFYQRWKI